MTAQLLTGAAIAEKLDDLATLRLTIFEEYPYLYRGRRDDELKYLQSYAETADACVILAADGAKVIGAATGLPLVHADLQTRTAFAGSPYPLAGIYYLGELLLLSAYRSRGRGQKLLAQMEGHIRSLGRYSSFLCATVERPADHPLRPPGYLPISRFLGRTGFVRLPGVSTEFAWRETDGVKRQHPMQFWSKELVGAVQAP